MSAAVVAHGAVTVVAAHATHPGYRSVHWSRSDNYSVPGMQPMPMWVPESTAPNVGDSIRVTVEFPDAQIRTTAMRHVSPDDLALLDRALRIADEAMFDVLQVNCIDQDGHGLVLGLTNADASEVHTLPQADERIVEAFEWLHGRGYVQLGRDGLGEHIIVERRPGEQ